MKMYGIARIDTYGTSREICVGSSPISGKPYWANPSEDPTVQPLLFREASYAQWCTDIAKRKDEEAGASSYTYALYVVDFEAF